MGQSLTYTFKQMFVVLAIGALVFHFARPLAIQFSSERDFSRRRYVWFFLTVVAFLSPNFWPFVLLATPLLLWAGRKDTNPIALYLVVMQVAPLVPVNVPMPGINGLIELDYYRLLSFCLLIPTAWRLRHSTDANRSRTFGAMDVLLLGYGVLQVVLYIVPDSRNHVIIEDSPSNMLRRVFLFLLDIYVLYYAVGRSCLSRRKLAEAMAAVCVSCVLMASLGIFESLRHWLLYYDITARWSNGLITTNYPMRNGILRAQVAAGRPIYLGYLLAIGFGFWLYLQSYVKRTRTRIFAVLLLWLGQLATISRGPWLGAVAIYFAFAAVGPRAFSRFRKAIGVSVLIAGLMFASPLGDRIIQLLPFMGGTVDSDTLLYRQRLLNRSLEIIQLHPFFGDRFRYLDMEDLRQGEGLIDFVNTYLHVAVSYGLVGLSLFLGFMLLGILKSYRRMTAMRKSDPDFALLGSSLIACMVGTAVMIADSSLIGAILPMYYSLMGLAAAYINVDPSTDLPTAASSRLDSPSHPNSSTRTGPRRSA
jgi:O-antigen ligase